MEEKVISFVSSRKRGFNPDMMALKESLSEASGNYSFRYFLKSDQTGNFLVNKGVSFEKKSFCNNAKNLICIDDSLPETMAEDQDLKKILFAIPYDYQFKSLVDSKADKKNTDFKKYSHIFTGSKFVSDLLKHQYDVSGVTLIEDICHPMGWSIAHEENQKTVFERFFTFWPGMKGKKILSIITSGKQTAENAFQTEVDLRGLLDAIREDWFVLTNDSGLHELAQALPIEYADAFGYMKDISVPNKLLYVTDLLVTNSSYFATTFAAKRKAFYWIRHDNTGFEQYMDQRYPEMDFAQVIKAGLQDLEKVNKELCEYFSYEPQINPCGKLMELLL